MPQALKSMLLSKLEMIYPKALKIMSTAQKGRQNTFPFVHYSFWFKYRRRVHSSRKGGLASETPKLLWVSQETVKMSKTQSVPGKSQAKVELELKL